MIGEVAGTSHSRIELSGLTEANLKLQVTSATGLVGSSLATGSSLLMALGDEYDQWLSYIVTSTQAPVTACLTLDMGAEYGVNKVVFVAAGSTATSAFIISVMYSTDGVDFLLVPIDGHTQSTLDTATWTFPSLNTRYWKFLITKNGADDINTGGDYVYEVGAKSISFYEEVYDPDEGNTFISIASSVTGADGDPLEFQKVALKACELLPTGTDIHYSVSVDGGSSYVAIAPCDRENPSKPAVLDFSQAVASTNEDSTDIYDVTVGSMQLDYNRVSTFVRIGEADEILNWYIPAGSTSSLVEDNVIIYRNVGSKTRSTDTVRGVAPGWSFNEETGTYSTIARVDDPAGVSIDLGSTTMTIDGVDRTGVVLLAAREHSISITLTNWSAVTPGLSSLEGLEAADPLYPYNHKLLIEGYDYASSFPEEKIYSGVNLFAELKMSYVPVHEFNTQIENDDMVSYTRDADPSSNLAFVLKTNSLFGDQASEYFLVEYKLTNRTFTTLVLRAVLTTEDPSVSPVFYGYTVKLG